MLNWIVSECVKYHEAQYLVRRALEEPQLQARTGI